MWNKKNLTLGVRRAIVGSKKSMKASSNKSIFRAHILAVLIIMIIYA